MYPRRSFHVYAARRSFALALARLRSNALGLTFCWCSLSVVAEAQAPTPIPLDYNFNGIVHAGEDGLPDDPNGFRSISDRALDFTAGVPNDPLLSEYTLVDTAGVLDIVHLGDRNKVASGAHFFDAVANGDKEGIQPDWLPSVDQSGPQITTLTTPIPIPLNQSTTAGVLFHVSNGGGKFEIVYGFGSGATLSVSAAGPDWFGGSFLGTGSVDLGLPDGNLGITEQVSDLTAFGGDELTSITFQNADNSNGGYAIFAANVVVAATASNTFRNAGTNPASYLTVTRPVLGSTYTATVDMGNTTGHSIAVIVGSATPDNFLLPGGQSVLINPLDPGGELLGLTMVAGPTAIFNLTIPADISFSGFTLSTQAIHVGGVPSFALSNAYDHVLGL